jgi:hypothetical protein
LLFEASLDSVWGGVRVDSGARFKELVVEYYPWREDDALTPDLAAQLLYHEARNPLAHDLGVGKNRITFPGLPRGDQRAVMLAKGALTVDEIENLLRPDGERPSFATIRGEPNAWVIDVAGLTCGTFVLLHRLLADSWQADLAEETAHALVTGNMIDYGAVVSGERCLSNWGEIQTIEEYENLLDEQVLIVRVPRVNERRRPPMAHDGLCRDLEPDRVAQHLRDGQGGRYFWARDLEVARQVFRGPPLLQPTRRSRSFAPSSRTRSSVIRSRSALLHSMP